MKKLGFGFMRLPLTDPEDKGSIDIELTKKMVDEFLARGFTYFDTAWPYCNFNSENALREALVERHPRESYTVATKLHCVFFNTKEERDHIFAEQLRKTGAGYFDYYLIHAVNAEFYKKYTELDCFNWLSDLKARGLVKNMGFSFHDSAEVLDKVLTEHPEMDFVQLQINYLDWDSERVQSEKCYEVARKHNNPIIIMEPVKGGALANVPDEVEKMFREHSPELSAPSWAIRYAAGLDGVFMVLSGMSDMAQLCDNTGYMQDFKPLDDEELEIVKKAAKMIRRSIAIPCTACSYCTDGCPMNIPIPDYFTLYNADKKKDYRPSRDKYGEISEGKGLASECIACGQCEGVCPQKLPIIENLKKVSMHFERK
jgi:predicted aldo/keto reductase-like oxidoreductase